MASVDLAGFTALTDAHGDIEAADLAERFTNLARDALAAGDHPPPCSVLLLTAVRCRLRR